MKNNVSELIISWWVLMVTVLAVSIRNGNLAGQLDLGGRTLQTEGRRMTNLETISASWIICDSWAGVAGTVSLAISQGGPTTLVYGTILMLVLVGACALTLAEIASVYPTAGGQYHWTSILAPKSSNRALVSFTIPVIIQPC